MSFFKILFKIFGAIILIFISIVVSVIALAAIAFIIIGKIIPDDNHLVKDKYQYIYGKEESKNKLLSIKINGVILGSEEEAGPQFLDFTDHANTVGYTVKKTLYDAANDSSIKGVILEINSPGGTIYGAHAIADGVKYFHDKTNKPVVAYIGGMAASGAYWSAASTDYIIADYGSLTGSIGVISGPFKYYNGVVSEDGGVLQGGIVTQKGIETTYITAGKYKDFGNPYRKLTDEEIKITQQGVDNEYNNFVDFVSEHRDITRSEIKDKIGALAYDDKTAKDLRLIDQIGNREDSYEYLAKKTNIQNNFQIVEENEKKSTNFFSDLLKSQSRGEGSKVGTLTFCRMSSLILAYHGDVTELCQGQ